MNRVIVLFFGYYVGRKGNIMRKVVFAAIFVIISTALWGQSNDLLDRFLEVEEADVATSLLLIAQASGELPLEAVPQDGFFWGAEQNFGKYLKNLTPEDPISLGLFYLALFKAFDIKGGLMYNALGTPRYAAMEAGYLGYVEPSRLYYTRAMAPYEVLTGITYVTDALEGGTL